MKKRKPVTRQLPRPVNHDWLIGYAVVVATPDLIGRRTEYWAYDPAVLNTKQRKQLGVLSWKRFHVKIEDGDNG
jgi:hypothetical protein